jgi:serine/threonine-protein kinase RsbW
MRSSAVWEGLSTLPRRYKYIIDMNKRIIIESDLGNIKQAVDQIRGLLENIGADESDMFDIRLCLEEALINAIKYGNKFEKSKKVIMDFSYKNGKAVISIEDNGRGFNLGSVPDPTTDENILKGSGRGVFLMRHLMDRLESNNQGNRITMTKHLKSK